MQDFLRGKNGRGPSTEIGEVPPESKWKGEKLIAYGPSGYYNFGKIYPTYRYFKENIKNIRTKANKLFRRGESESGDIDEDLDKNFKILYNKNESLLIKKLPGSRTFLLYNDIDYGNPVAAIAFCPDNITYVYIDSTKVGDYGKKWIPLTDPIIYSTSASSGQSSSSASKSVGNNGSGQSSSSSAYEPVGNNGVLRTARSLPYNNVSLRLSNRPKKTKTIFASKKTFAGGKRRRNKTKKVHRRRRL
jgi:hypothetical protein